MDRVETDEGPLDRARTLLWRRSSIGTVLGGLFYILSSTLQAAHLSDYNVVWKSPSKDEHGSMPIGNGDLAANVWVEPSGDLVFYISKSDAWSGNGRLLKLGRVRVKFDEPLFRPGTEFKQELDLKNGKIVVTSKRDTRLLGHSNEQLGAKTGQSTLSFFIDANDPLIHVVVESDTEFKASAALEVWRATRRQLEGRTVPRGISGRKSAVFVEPDIVLPAKGNTISWYHRNHKSCYKDTLDNQHLGHLVEKYPDPLMNLTFGGAMAADGMVSKNDNTLITEKPLKSLHLKVYAHTEQTDTADEWVKNLAGIREKADEVSLKKARKAHEEYWNEFWDRSWIYATGRSSLRLPANSHPWRLGVDSNGTNRFGGEISGPAVIGRALSADEIAKLAGEPRSTEKKIREETMKNGCTVTAWIKPGGGENGRILDKCTAGKSDGISFDTAPGLSLRLIFGNSTMIHPKCLKADEWQHVAATANTETGVRRIYLNGKLVKEEKEEEKGIEKSDAHSITQAYILQRWIQACAGRGKYPIKFNGTLFTVAESGQGMEDPDYRRWGGCYWFQNTRLIYWPMLYSGDFDQMEPLWKMYRDALPLLKDRVKKYYGHDGIFCSETMYFWGTYCNRDFGWGNKDVHTRNSYVRYYWDSGNELTQMMLDYYDITRKDEFVTETLLPIADNVVLFYDQHYKRNAEGKVHFSPAMSLETWHKAEDPSPIIIGLKTILTRMLGLPEKLTSHEQRKRWAQFLAELPEIPYGEKDGKKWIKPARKYVPKKANSENPELYGVFPYRAYTQFKPDLEVALETWRRRLVKRTGCWYQDAIQAALLGLTNEAKRDVLKNAAPTRSNKSRFPAFWGPGHDWTPDQDHGGVLLIAFQRMIMQTERDPSSPGGFAAAGKIHLAPSWPKEWNCEFKLHAPNQTVVEGRVEGGKVIDLKVTPESRMKDIVLGE